MRDNIRTAVWIGRHWVVGPVLGDIHWSLSHRRR
jgi:hypothetical protein